MNGHSVTMAPAAVTVLASNGRGHSPDELVDLCLAKLLSVSDAAPDPIKMQALAFRDRIRPLLLHYMVQAIRSDRTTLHNRLKEAGQHEAANLILKL